MDEFIEFLIDALGDFWFILLSPWGLILTVLVLLGGSELVYHFMNGGWVG